MIGVELFLLQLLEAEDPNSGSLHLLFAFSPLLRTGMSLLSFLEKIVAFPWAMITLLSNNKVFSHYYYSLLLPNLLRRGMTVASTSNNSRIELVDIFALFGLAVVSPSVSPEQREVTQADHLSLRIVQYERARHLCIPRGPERDTHR